MRIVVDTNVVMSAIFFGGKPKRLIEKVMAGEVNACISDAILTEYEETVKYLCTKYPSRLPGVLLTAIVSAMDIIKTQKRIKVCRDPDDDKFIECALDAQCRYIISGDKDLLAVGDYRGVHILTVTEFLELSGN